MGDVWQKKAEIARRCMSKIIGIRVGAPGEESIVLVLSVRQYIFFNLQSGFGKGLWQL